MELYHHSQYIFMAWCLIKDRNTLHLPLPLPLPLPYVPYTQYVVLQVFQYFDWILSCARSFIILLFTKYY